MDTLTPVVLLGSLGFMLVNLVKYVRARDWDPAITTILVWLVGFILVALAAHTSLTENTPVPGLAGVTFGSIDTWGQVLLGASILSVLGVVDKALKAIDNTRSSAGPSLLGQPPVD
jgi:hypothetical protein